MHAKFPPESNSKLIRFPAPVETAGQSRVEKKKGPASGGTREKQARIEDLEAYRGVAALLIVVYHAYQHSRIGTTYVYLGLPFHFVLRNLEGGVALFFVLSGFLIFLPFVRAALEQGSPLSARSFMVRRAIRIFPLYYLVMVIVWTFRYFGSADQWTDLWRHLTFTQIFDNKYIFWTVGPAWSLAVEVLFYLFIAAFGPFVYWVCGKVEQVWQRLALMSGLVGLLCVVSLGYKWWAFFIAGIPQEDYTVYFGPLAKLDNFGLGMFVAIIFAAVGSRRRLGSLGSNLLRTAGIGLLLVVCYYRETNQFLTLYFHTLCSLGFAAVLATSVFGPSKSWWKRGLGLPFFQFLGLISYSLYLWHEPVLIELADTHSLLYFKDPLTFPWHTLVLLVAACVAGAISYWGLEYPTMQMRHLFNAKGRLFNRYSTAEASNWRENQG